jgi:hypothetical protein
MRRHLILAAACLALVAPKLGAQPAGKSLPTLRTVGVFSLLGDSVQVAAATDAPSDTRIERTARESLDFKGIGFDLLAIRAARDNIERVQPAAKVQAFRGTQALTVAEQRAVAEGAARAELPAWMVKTVNDNGLSHLLLITRSRGTIDAQTADGYAIGRGTVDGIGFFIDTLYTIQNKTTGALSSGLLAPYLQVRLTLMDAMNGEVVATYDVKDAFVFGSKEVQTAADPWNFMTPAEKVQILRQLAEQGLARGMRALLVSR